MSLLTPAADWRDALPLGDGTFSAMVYGSVSPETILFNHDKLWYGGDRLELPDFSDEFHHVRELGFEGRMQEANDFIPNLIVQHHAHGSQHTYHPAFDLKIRSEQMVGFSHYRRTLDFSRGEARVTWQDGDTAYERDFFISRARHIGVMRYTSSRDAVTAAFQLCEHNLYDALDMGGQAHDVLKELFQLETRAEGDKLFIRVHGSYHGVYGGVLKLIPEGGRIRAGVEQTWTDQLSSLPMLWEMPLEKRDVLYVEGAARITALLGIYVASSDPDADSRRMADMLDGIDADYDALLAEHTALHGEIYDRLALTLRTSHMMDAHAADADPANDYLLLDAYDGKASGDLLVKLFDYGRYLLMTSSNESGIPPTLQGNHNGDYFPAWQSFYVHNENTQMFYWQALSGRMTEVTGALFKFFEERMEDFRTNAKHLFNCRGIFIPLCTDENHALMNVPAPHQISFTGVAAWIAAHFYDYYLFTGDRAFLAEHAVPFMEEAALFYEDYLLLSDDGYYTIFPSNSPENAPRNSFAADTDLSVVMNPGIPTTFDSTIDTALVRELLQNLTNAYRTLGIREDKAALYTDMLGHIRPFRINEDGALAEWIHEGHTDNYAHRHLSHLYPLFPGFQITKEETPALFEAARTAVDKRLAYGLTAQTGWSLAHLSSIFARLGDGNASVRCFDLLTRTCVGKNLFTYHNDFRNMGISLRVIFGRSNPYQIDANMGITAAMMEMILASRPDGTLLVAQALPAEWLSGSLAKVATRCGALCTVSWDETGIKTELEATDDRIIRVVLPNGYDSDGQRTFDLPVRRGGRYTITARKINTNT